MRRPSPNICPCCLAPLTLDAQCVMPECQTNILCGQCGVQMTIYSTCPNEICIQHVPVMDSDPYTELQDDLFSDITQILEQDPASVERSFLPVTVRAPTIVPGVETHPPRARSDVVARRESLELDLDELFSPEVRRNTVPR